MTHSRVCLLVFLLPGHVEGLKSSKRATILPGLCRLDPVLRIKLATLADLSDCLFTPDSARLKCATAKEPCKNSTHGAVFHTGVTGSSTCITLSQHEANMQPTRQGAQGPRGPGQLRQLHDPLLVVFALHPRVGMLQLRLRPGGPEGPEEKQMRTV